ncbi:hypothetical protein ACFL1V_03095 [Pseudomonadota bacterium]
MYRALFLSLCLLLPAVADAVRVKRLTLAELRAQADSIVIATPISKVVRLETNPDAVWTDYVIEIREVLAGNDSTGARTISFAGGIYQGLDMGLLDLPTLEIEKTYLLILNTEQKWACPTVGWGQGIFEFVGGTDYSNARALVSFDGEPLEMGPDGITRGSRVRVENDNLVDIPAQRPSMRLESDSGPIVTDYQGKEIAQPIQKAPEPAARVADRAFASLQDVRDLFSKADQP